jgi:FkbM family methyltransferase
LSGSRNVFVDVGANIGTTCVPIARASGCRALAIEPVGENFRRLKINVEANGLADRILLAQRAVQRAPGRIRMCRTVRQSGGNFVWRDGLANIAPEEVAGFEEVEGDTLVAIARSVGLRAEEIALVWADVQGCEAEVIESGAALWALGVPLWAEVEPHSLVRQGSLASFADLSAAHFDRFILAGSPAARRRGAAGAHRRARGADRFGHARAVQRRCAVPAAGVSS